MNRNDQTAIILVALITLAGFIFWMFMQQQDADAVARRDYSACWSDECERRIIARIR